MADPPSHPDQIGRYTIEKPLAHGGMGRLFLAHDPVLGRPLAIKVIREELADEDSRARFLQEARAAGRLRHPNVVTVFDAGEHEGHPFIAMEYVSGHTLSELIRGGTPLALGTKLWLAEQLCRGLADAHRNGLVHRDIKPSNLMVDPEGTLKILDFGIARIAESELTMTGAALGSVNYMSPEQVTGKKVDHRSDVFSVGSVLHELLSSKQAFPGSLQDGVLHRIERGEAASLTDVCPDLAPSIVSLVERAMALKADHRYQDLDAMGDDLAAARAAFGGDTTAPVGAPDAMETVMTPAPGSRRVPPPSSRSRAIPSSPTPTALAAGHTPPGPDAPPARANRRWLSAAGGLAAVAIVAAAVLLWPSPEPPGPVPDAIRPSQAEAGEPPEPPPALVVAESRVGENETTAADTDPAPSPPPRPEPQPESPPPASTPPPVAEDRLAALRRQALDAFVRGDREASLEAAAAVLQLAPDDGDTATLLGRLLQDAQGAVDAARSSVGPAGTASPLFAQAERAATEAADALASGARPTAVRRLWTADGLFRQAAQIPAEVAAADASPTPLPPATDEAETPTDPPEPADAAAREAEGAAAADQAAITDVLAKYRAALEALDGTALAVVYPAVPPETVSGLAQYESYVVTLTGIDTRLEGARATVRVQLSLRVRSRTGIAGTAAGPAVFSLERRGPDDWIISQIDMSQVR